MTSRSIGRALFFASAIALSCWWSSICPLGPVMGFFIVGCCWGCLIGIWLWTRD